MSEDELEFHCQWSQCSGELAALRGVVVKLQTRSASAYVRGQDAVAMAMREVAQANERRRSG